MTESKKDQYSGYQWSVTSAPRASSRWDDIWFEDPDTGWGVNSNGQIWHTTDGGETWDKQFQVPANQNLYFRSIHFANKLKGWAGTTKMRRNRLLQTADGGGTWTMVDLPDGPPFGICGLSVVNESTIYGSGFNDPSRQPAGIIKSTDGGQSWESIDMSPWANNLIDIHFIDENRGWVVGGKKTDFCAANNPYLENPDTSGRPQYGEVKPVVLYTEDGGRTWVNQIENLVDEFPCGSWGWKIHQVNQDVIFISVENLLGGSILKTLDGGKTWERKVINDVRMVDGIPVSNANLEGIGFIDENFGWVGGWGDARFIGNYNSVTRDGGETWVAEDANSDDGVTIGSVRINANRFRFFGDPVEVGFLSGLNIYKLTRNTSLPKATQPAAAAIAPTSLRAIPDPDSKKGARIDYMIPKGGAPLSINIWNAFAVRVRTLAEIGEAQAGAGSITWDGLKDDGTDAGNGVYIVRIASGDHVESTMVRLGGS